MAQLGCNELTPPSQRFPTRMFRDVETGEWRPYFTYKRKKDDAGAAVNGSAVENMNGGVEKKEEEEYEFVEDPDSDEGAVYPLQGTFLSSLIVDLCWADELTTLTTQAAA